MGQRCISLVDWVHLASEKCGKSEKGNHLVYPVDLVIWSKKLRTLRTLGPYNKSIRWCVKASTGEFPEDHELTELPVVGTRRVLNPCGSRGTLSKVFTSFGPLESEYLVDLVTEIRSGKSFGRTSYFFSER